MLTSEAFAENAVSTISGLVKADGKALEGVTVTAILNSTGMQYSFVSTKSGFYRLSNMMYGGPYTIIIEHFDYKPIRLRDIYLPPTRNLRIDADLATSEFSVTDDGFAPFSSVDERMVDVVPQEDFSLLSTKGMYYSPGEQLDPVTDSYMKNATNRLGGSVYDYYSFNRGNLLGASVNVPVIQDKWQMAGAAEYSWEEKDVNAAARMDLNIGSQGHMDLSFKREYGINAGELMLTNGFSEGKLSNKLYANYSSLGLTASEEFSYVGGISKTTVFFGDTYIKTLPGEEEGWNHFHVGVKEDVQIGRRIRLCAVADIGFPMTFSPEIGLSYNIIGNNKLFLCAYTGILDVDKESSKFWSTKLCIGSTLPYGIVVTVAGIMQREWEKLFVISPTNVLSKTYCLAGKVGKSFSNGIQGYIRYAYYGDKDKNKLTAMVLYKIKYVSDKMTTAVGVMGDSQRYVGARFLQEIYGAGISLDWQYKKDYGNSFTLGCRYVF